MSTRFFGSVVALALAAGSASAQIRVAFFGDNDTDDLLQANGFITQIVSDAQIATPGFLDAFDVFYYTRDGTSFGNSLSAGAINQVRNFVKKRYVLFNSDFADDTGNDDQGPDPRVQQITVNAAQWVGALGGGYIGEFTGAFAALDSNGGGFSPLGIVSGSASAFNAGFPWDGNVNKSIDHPVLAGVNFPFNPTSIEWGSIMSGIDPSTVIAKWDDGSPSIIAGTIPAPGAAALLAAAGLGAARRRR